MITLLEINKAINSKIENALLSTDFKNVKIVAQDLAEPVIRPCIKVEIESCKSSRLAYFKEKSLICRIYYFASDRNKYKIENAKMGDILENAFLDDLKVKEGFLIPIDEVELYVTDTVLVCSFDLYTAELIPSIDTAEPMEQIIYKTKEER